MSASHRFRPEDLDGLRRSLALSPQLPVEQVLELLDDHRLLLLERAELEQQLLRLEPAFKEVRAVLNRLYALLHDAGTVEPGSAGRPGG